MMLNKIYVDDLIKRALTEDINYIDLATDYLTREDSVSTAQYIAKDDGVLCGIDVAMRVFHILDDDIKTEIFIRDGEKLKKGDIIGTVSGSTKTILEGERTSLNILQHMSGVATATSAYAAQCEGTKATIADTRKTLPGLRPLEKYAVMIGGGRNHRYNLSDAAMIKDNHADAYGGITNAVNVLRSKMGHMNKIEVEVRNKEELLEALAVQADVIMLDNMSPAEMAECVKLTDGRAKLEASGGITLESVREIAMTGVDIISVGAITHSVKAFDISLKIKK
ncbi:MAG: carboxylating nicotinate-nucleotide diphosphorylase [Oscillospiraceae bacterium]|nr:carboxylating nicotinate-nucleotide diphosphorylase [Oscillospiraceae bacterium]MDY2847200.1 carboxylating nicotinate-nucleotide diphosphorylase [Oscillospiraceae bacterium]